MIQNAPTPAMADTETVPWTREQFKAQSEAKSLLGIPLGLDVSALAHPVVDT